MPFTRSEHAWWNSAYPPLEDDGERRRRVGELMDLLYAAAAELEEMGMEVTYAEVPLPPLCFPKTHTPPPGHMQGVELVDIAHNEILRLARACRSYARTREQLHPLPSNEPRPLTSPDFSEELVEFRENAAGL